MNRGSLATCLLFLLVACPLVAWLSPASADTEKTTIIFPPAAERAAHRENAVQGIGKIIHDAVKEGLFNSGKYTIVADETVLAKLTDEEHQQYLSGDYDPTTVAQMGVKVGAQQLMRFSIVENSCDITTSTTPGHYYKTTYIPSETTTTCDAMTISVSLEIFDIAKATLIQMYHAEYKKTPWSDILTTSPEGVRKKAINSIVSQLLIQIFPPDGGVVKKVYKDGKTNDTLVTDYGGTRGAVVGQEVQLIRKDRDGFDTKIGTATITDVQPDKSRLTITTATSRVKEGDSVKAEPAVTSPGDGDKDYPPTAKYPRVMVLVPEQHLKLKVPDPAGETELIKELTDKGFTVVDQQVSDDILKNDELRKKMDDDPDGFLAEVRNHAHIAEIIIYGEAFSQGVERMETSNGIMWRCGARIEVRAVKRDTGQIICADGAQAVAADATEELAGKRALKSAAVLLCKGSTEQEGFLAKLCKRLVDKEHTQTVLICTVNGVDSLEQANAIEKDFSKVADDLSVDRMVFDNGLLRESITTTLSCQQFSDKFNGLNLKEKLTLQHATANALEYRYEKE